MPDKIKKYDYPHSPTGGVKPMSIRGIFESERCRLSEEFTDEERKWRKQWIKDQQLSPNEPRPVPPEWIKETRNPIRRFVSKPWQILEDRMSVVTGKGFAAGFRYVVPKTLVGIMSIYVLWYHLKYNQNDWTRAYGPTIMMPKPVAYPGDKNYPVKRERFHPIDYDDRGFKNRTVFL
ncbi:NADH dehydrogenase [ubiquinone] 1 beta subcomplex subunit 6-like [Stegodyphus dumicola]|uniref:NADH dehydrogenase [ubiquinone] 1 beta subcomplex subunit 6-like n=1 Tax=Stegodyphus dumicola TaxID=202533 RepID=UPI0015A884F8|nr:NADH dehydrogenase [ubiquinone] 1 beta subcomplex subunit 6-like [Stegodyphus dumicola]